MQKEKLEIRIRTEPPSGARPTGKSSAVDKDNYPSCRIFHQSILRRHVLKPRAIALGPFHCANDICSKLSVLKRTTRIVASLSATFERPDGGTVDETDLARRTLSLVRRAPQESAPTGLAATRRRGAPGRATRKQSAHRERFRAPAAYRVHSMQRSVDVMAQRTKSTRVRSLRRALASPMAAGGDSWRRRRCNG